MTSVQQKITKKNKNEKTYKKQQQAIIQQSY
jgi:hypothetical protein